MRYDEKAGFYIYERKGAQLAIRRENDELVFRDSLKLFLQELANNDMHYNFELKNENSLIFIPEEKSMLSLYNGMQLFLDEKDLIGGKLLIDEFEKLYPNAFKYTDIDFIKAKFWEQANISDSASYYFNRFLLFSEKKYSGFFRGYSFDVDAWECYLNERQYAQNYIYGQPVDEPENCHKQLKPMFYYQSFSQGFVLNREDFGSKKNNLFGIGLEYNTENNFLVGVSNIWLSNEKYIYRSSIFYSENHMDISLSGSYQLYKSKDNSLGIKISPSLILSQYGKKDTVLSKSPHFNPGLSLSLGYHFNQRWYFGASYTAFLFNEFTHKSLKEDYFLENIYDISLYYQIIKGISFKVGIDTGYPIIGFGFTGSSLGYFFRNKGFGVRMNYY